MNPHDWMNNTNGVCKHLKGNHDKQDAKKVKNIQKLAKIIDFGGLFGYFLLI